MFPSALMSLMHCDSCTAVLSHVLHEVMMQTILVRGFWKAFGLRQFLTCVTGTIQISVLRSSAGTTLCRPLHTIMPLELWQLLLPLGSAVDVWGPVS